MRRLSASILLSVFLLHIACMLGYMAYFYTHRSEIANIYCVNLQKPDCKGGCHLAKTLKHIQTADEANRENSNQNQDHMSFEWNSLGIVLNRNRCVGNNFCYPVYPTLSLCENIAEIELPPPRVV